MSTLRADYPIKINGTDLFRPESWEVSTETVESTFQTEAGTDELVVTRYGKTTVSASFACTDTWLSTFKGWSESASLTVKYYDPSIPGYAEKTMRMRGFKSVMNVYSDYITESLGLYTVSFNLIEF